MKKCTSVFAVVLMLLIVSTSLRAQNSTLFFEDFESGWGDWYPDHGVWQVGVPPTESFGAHSGKNVAGTVLGGVYPVGANSRLISPWIDLSLVQIGDQIQLKFWHWFDLKYVYLLGEDYGVVEVSEDGVQWRPMSTSFSRQGGGWTQYIVNLANYAGKTVQIGFHMVAVSSSVQQWGWYIDDVAVETPSNGFRNPENFESGIGNWYADKGVWQVGVPPTEPYGAHSDKNVAGTVLGGVYPVGANSRLISPAIRLKQIRPGGRIQLRFWHWFDLKSIYILGDDYGVVQVSVEGEDWLSKSDSLTGNSGGWTPYIVDLTDYAGKTVQIGFYIIAFSSSVQQWGWYIDDVRIDPDSVVSVLDRDKSNTGNSVLLFPNYPNPFNPETEILFELPKTSQVVLKIYNTLGQEVKILIDGVKPVGRHLATWDGRDNKGRQLPSGLYLYRLQTGTFVRTMKMVLMK